MTPAVGLTHHLDFAEADPTFARPDPRLTTPQLYLARSQMHGAPGNPGLSNHRRRGYATRWCGDDVTFDDRPGTMHDGWKGELPLRRRVGWLLGRAGMVAVGFGVVWSRLDSTVTECTSGAVRVGNRIGVRARGSTAATVGRPHLWHLMRSSMG